MPTTVAEAFAAVGFRATDITAVRWGTKPTTCEPGVYVISLTQSLDSYDGKLSEALLDTAGFRQWIRVCPDLTVDGVRPTIGQLMERINSFWMPDEVVLYIGLATSLSGRLDGYFRTPIGAPRPHSGGYFIKLLSNLDQLWVHYAKCGANTASPAVAEDEMLRRFCENVSGASKRALHDPAHPFPFANLEWPKGVRKAHGLGGVRMKNKAEV